MLSRRAFLASLSAASLSSAALPATLRGTIAPVAPGGPITSRAAFQRMVNAAAAEGRALVLQPGSYDATDILLPEGTHLIGKSSGVRLLCRSAGSALRAQDVSHVRLTSLLIDGTKGLRTKDATGLVHFEGVENAIIEDCRLGGARRNALHLERCGGRIEANRIAGAGDAGIYSVQSSGVDIIDNDVSTCGNGGILVHRWDKGQDGSSVRNNRVADIAAHDGGTGENGNGINIYQANGVSITDNAVRDCAFTAVRANSGSHVTISRNQTLRCGETAIYVEFKFVDATVTDNMIDTAANGISIANFNEGGRLARVTGNSVRNLSLTGPYYQPSGFGIGIAAEADTVVAGNVIEGAPLWALQLGWGPYMQNVVAQDNQIRGCGIGCAVSVVEGAGHASITDNLFVQAAEGAIFGFRWEKRATGELVGGGASLPDNLTISGNRVS